MNFLISSNLALFIPLIAAYNRGAEIYLSLALAMCIISPLYHAFATHYPKKKITQVIRYMDWIMAITCYAYMLYFLFNYTDPRYSIYLAIAGLASILFFFYGFKFGNYKKLHPWFHVIVSVISALVVSL